MNKNQISYEIIGAVLKIHTELGSGLLESVYEKSQALELSLMGFSVKSQLGIPLSYKSLNFDFGYRLDLLIDDKIIVEIKSVDAIHDIHFKQLLTYLRLSLKKLGILINFNSLHLKDSIKRVGNNL